jgi:hypothetical protein
MFRLNFRIATKLAMAGGVALLTVGAIALNQSWDRQARADLAAEADNADAVRVATLTAAVATRRVVIMGRDIRLAMSEPEVDDVLKRAGGFGAEGVKALETAAAMAATGHGRQRLEHAKEVTQKYTAAVGEVAAVRKEVLGLQARLSELGRSWSAPTSNPSTARSRSGLISFATRKTPRRASTARSRTTSNSSRKRVRWCPIAASPQRSMLSSVSRRTTRRPSTRS